MSQWQLNFRYTVGDFSLRIADRWSSTTTCVIGASGTGKSTFFEILLGLRNQGELSGNISFANQILLDSAKQVKTSPTTTPFAWVPQNYGLFPHLSAEQNLTFARPQHSITKLDEIVSSLALDGFLHKFPNQLSGGEQQRVALGRAIASDKPCLLLDEPLSALDANLRAASLDYIMSVRDRFQRSIVYVSHDLQEVERLGGHLIRLPNEVNF